MLLFAASSVLLGTNHSTAATGGAPAAPPGNPYTPPAPLPAHPPGTLIWAQQVPLPLNPPATVWRILYHSRTVSGKDIAVSGFALIPDAAPNGPRPVYAWAHGSAGQGDSCAPSRHLRANLPPYGGPLVARGAAVVASDYEGLGTPGEPTPYVGVAEGHAVLDSVRAIRSLPNAGVLGPVVIAGESQGGGAALWAAQLARSYASDLDARGVVALAPAAQLTTIVGALRRLPFRRYLGAALWAIDGLKAGYPSRIDLSTLLTAKARRDLHKVARECATRTIARWRGQTVSAVFRHNPLSVPSLVKLLNDVSPGATDPKMPILLAQGDRDEQIPVTVSAQVQERYCRLGAVVTRHVYRGVNHERIADAASDDAVAWISDRLDGKPAPRTC